MIRRACDNCDAITTFYWLDAHIYLEVDDISVAAKYLWLLAAHFADINDDKREPLLLFSAQYAFN